jgi:PAS fold
MICPTGKAKNFSEWDWTAKIRLNGFNKFDFWRKRGSENFVTLNVSTLPSTAPSSGLLVEAAPEMAIAGKHHGMFVEPSERDSAAYREFWAKLNRGEYQSAEYKRIGKGGREVWIEASYNPICDTNGKPFKVVKFAIDVTAKKIRSMEYAGKIDAILRA